MKSKDQSLLEEAYIKILSENDKFQLEDSSSEGELENASEEDLSTYNGYYHFMINTFGKDAISYAREYMEKDEYADNLRIAFVGDPKTESLYNKIKDQGCCGYADNKEIPTNLTNGIKAYFGYNYGH